MKTWASFKKGQLSLKVENLFVPTALTMKFPWQFLHSCPNCVNVNLRTLTAPWDTFKVTPMCLGVWCSMALPLHVCTASGQLGLLE